MPIQAKTPTHRSSWGLRCLACGGTYHIFDPKAYTREAIGAAQNAYDEQIADPLEWFDPDMEIWSSYEWAQEAIDHLNRWLTKHMLCASGAGAQHIVGQRIVGRAIVAAAKTDFDHCRTRRGGGDSGLRAEEPKQTAEPSEKRTDAQNSTDTR